MSSEVWYVFHRVQCLALYSLSFLLTISPSFVFSYCYMFADDTKCYNVINSQDDVANLQHDLQCVSHWTLFNELTFQPAKCENLRISHKQNSFNRVYSLNSIGLNTICSSRDLEILHTH